MNTSDRTFDDPAVKQLLAAVTPNMAILDRKKLTDLNRTLGFLILSVVTNK